MKEIDVQELCELLKKKGLKLVLQSSGDKEETINSILEIAKDYLPEINGNLEEDEILKKELERAARRVLQQKKEQQIGRPGLIAALKEWRAEKAKSAVVPTYFILGNEVLLEIAELIPSNMEELMTVKGFGQSKAEKYGSEILDIISKEIEEVIPSSNPQENDALE